MPAVGARRSTRIFVPKAVAKAGGDAGGGSAAGSLRSGKRLPFAGPLDKRANEDGDEWLRVFGGNGCTAGLRWWRGEEDGEDFGGAAKTMMGSDADTGDQSSEAAGDRTGSCRFSGIVYQRKRSRSQQEEGDLNNRKYGIVFVRKPRKKKLRLAPSAAETSRIAEIRAGELQDSTTGLETRNRELRIEDFARGFRQDVGISREDLWFSSGNLAALAVLIDFSSGRSSSLFSNFLVPFLRWMRRTRSRFQDFVGYLLSGPIAGVFSLSGVHFLPLRRLKRVFSRKVVSCFGICSIYGAAEFGPLFSIDFSALPGYFNSMHLRIALCSMYLPACLARYQEELDKNFWAVVVEDYDSGFPSEMGFFRTVSAASLFPSVKRQFNAFQSIQSIGSGSLITQGSIFSKHQKKRSSLRHSRPRAGKPLNVIPSFFNAGEQHNIPFSLGSQKKSKLSKKNCSVDQMDSKVALAEVKQNIDSVRCVANILVVAADRCWREEGAEVMLESSGSNEWCLVVKLQGSVQYQHKPQELRPPVVNRFTHDYMWSGEEGWKLEFTDRWDWLVFKELHMECHHRNAQEVPLKTIPVPGVQEVSGYEDEATASFSRPDMYIKILDDEVDRALASKISFYDMDEEDEEWLEQLNSGLVNADAGGSNCLSDVNFEKIMFALEKEAYRNSSDKIDVDKAVDLCQDLGNRETVVAVFDYWLKKRKQKRAALIRVFRGPRVKRTLLLQQPFLRKKRSFKRQRSQGGRGKPYSYFEEAARQAAIRRVKQAEDAAEKAVDYAIQMRTRAQMYMANAELAAYKSVMALQIAEAISVPGSPSSVTSFLD